MGRIRYPHIYFEALGGGRDSATRAVHELDHRRGVTSFEEYKRVALAQLLDYLDGWTVDHDGEVVRFSMPLWRGRVLVLRRLGKQRWPKRYQRVIDLVNHYRKRISNTRRLHDREKLALEAARKLGIPAREAREILRRVRQRKFGF